MTLEEAEARILKLEKALDILVCLWWEERGQLKGLSGKIEKEVEPLFKEYLERKTTAAMR